MLKGGCALVSREELRSWIIDVREAQEYSYDYKDSILERVLTKMQNELNSQMKEVTHIEVNASGETKYELSEWRQAFNE